MALSGKTFRIFVSSTFSDLKEERNALQEKVFPRLKELCLQHGCRFQAVDLRWGVREEAGLDQQTMKICLGEIERCQKISPRPNFVVLLGDRYGWRPLPPEIPANEFEAIKKAIAGAEEKALLQTWYRRDDNAVPPIYCLQPRRVEVEGGAGDDERRRARDEEAAQWNEVEGRLGKILRGAVARLNFGAEQNMKYFASATGQEIEAGVMKAADAEKHVFCFFRNIEGLPKDTSAGVFADLDEQGAVDSEASLQLASLKERLRSRLKENVREYPAAWIQAAASTNHLDALCEDVWQSLSKVILSEISQMGDVDPVKKEVADHEAFGGARAQFFFGRDAYLQSIANYLKEPNTRLLAVFGASGSGKSALLAQAIEQAGRNHEKAEIAYRFIGATPASSDVRMLLEGLCRQITRAYGGDEPAIPTEYKELVEEFPKRLALATAVKPLCLFLDALDQFSESHNARNLLWLPSSLPENVSLIVSTAPADCWETLKKKVDPSCQIDLQPMTVSEGSQILETWLNQAGRALQKPQRQEVLDKFAKTGLPLYLKFAFEEARHWRSAGGVVELDPEVTGIIRQLFSRLSAESNHGKILAPRSLGYLRAAKNGLSEDEIIDVLSRDEEVFGDFRKRSFFQPPEQRLPVVIWSRFYFDMEAYLNERSADGVTLLGFFHRQMGDVVDADYLAGEDNAKIHAQLAAYFDAQPLFIEKDGQKTANLRKLSELPFQQTHGALWEGLYKTLTDFEFLEAKCTYSGTIHAPEGEKGRKIYGGVYELIEDYRRALTVYPVDK
jgi:NACHT domain- and WD repeat-containing protein